MIERLHVVSMRIVSQVSMMVVSMNIVSVILVILDIIKLKNAPSRARTYDPGVISTMLYRLSYESSRPKVKERTYKVENNGIRICGMGTGHLKVTRKSKGIGKKSHKKCSQ